MSTCSCSLDREDPREGWIKCLKMQRADFRSHFPLPSSATQVESWRHLDNAFCFSQTITCYIPPLFLGLLDFSPEIVLPEYYNGKELGGGRVDLCLTLFSLRVRCGLSGTLISFLLCTVTTSPLQMWGRKPPLNFPLVENSECHGSEFTDILKFSGGFNVPRLH